MLARGLTTAMSITTIASASAAGSAGPRPVVVGLTGSIGMGKSTASAFLKASGILVHDADACVHKLYAPGGAAVDAVAKAFTGTTVTNAEGGIDRALLSSAIMSAGRDASLKSLEAIVHPLVTADRTVFIDQAAAGGEWLVVLDVPLLMETMDVEARTKLLDALIVVSAPADIQRERVLARPGMSAEKLEALLARQKPDEEKRAAADFIVETGHPSYSPARAQLASCLADLAAQHDDRYQHWRVDDSARVAAVSFDLDETLWPTMPPILAASKVLGEAMHEHLPKCAAAGCAERAALREGMKELMEEQPLLRHDFTELRRLWLRDLASTHGDDCDAAVDAVVERFVSARSDVRAHFFADAAATLKAIRARGLPVGGLTNGNADVHRHSEVSTYFDFAVTAADAGAAKPHPVPFWQAAAAAGCRPCDLVHVGDDVTTDLVGALGAGCRAILVQREADRGEDEGSASEPAGGLNSGADAQAAALPPVDDARWRRVENLEQAVDVIDEWRATGEARARKARSR